jgi:hypothetical protein
MINGWQSFIIIVLLQFGIFANKFIYQFGFKRILEYESGKVDDAIANPPYTFNIQPAFYFTWIIKLSYGLLMLMIPYYLYHRHLK